MCQNPPWIATVATKLAPDNPRLRLDLIVVRLPRPRPDLAILTDEPDRLAGNAKSDRKLALGHLPLVIEDLLLRYSSYKIHTEIHFRSRDYSEAEI